MLVVFSDPDALAVVRFMSFLRDCARIERPMVVALRKRLKVMIHPEALRDMEDNGLR